jgi:hypothetical protein
LAAAQCLLNPWQSGSEHLNFADAAAYAGAMRRKFEHHSSGHTLVRESPATGSTTSSGINIR